MTTILYAQDMADLQGQLVRTAADIRRIETRLQNLDARLHDLQVEGESMQADYQKQRGKMAATIEAMTRMRRVPKEAVMIRPGGPLQAARTSMLLTASLPAIEHQANDIKKLLTDLEANQRELRTKTEEARAAKVNLDQSHATLTRLLAQRPGGEVRPEDQAAVNRIARQARSLRDLLSALEGGDASGVIALPESGIPAVEENEGILPVSGIIRTRYGQMDDIGAKAAGLTIETMAGAVVVAPLSGTVRFTGNFKGYGNIVIIAHPGGYHSLIAGLGTIYVTQGQAIVSGEPIGILEPDKNQNQASQQARPSIYYELRQYGQPVNPARKLPDLG